MSKPTIVTMPGDGIGNDVMDAAQIVLDKIGLDAEYVPADIGWEFWRQEGEPLPQRTLDTLKGCDCALFAAITSKPKEEAEKAGAGLLWARSGCKRYPGDRILSPDPFASLLRRPVSTHMAAYRR